MNIECIKVPYGKEVLNININSENLAGIVVGNNVPVYNENEILGRSLTSPINSKSLEDFWDGAEDPLFIINDATRPTPTLIVLENGFKTIKPKNPRFIVATGSHRAPTQQEYYQIMGHFYDEFKPYIFAHDARADQDMVYIGRSSLGTELKINKLVAEARKIIVIGSVEPHYFAGYTGGRKAFFPGVASYKSIEQNHLHALEPNAKTLALEENPVHEDMIDSMGFLRQKEIFAIMIVLDKDHRIYAAASGNIDDSFKSAVEKAKEVFIVKIPEKADIVVTVAKHPMDIDFYQSQKAIENAKLVLKNKGIIILVSQCASGTGDTQFIKLLSSCSTPPEVFNRIKEGYVLGYHKAAKLAEINLWAEMYAVTELPEEILRSMHIKPFNSLQTALDESIQKKGKNSKVLFMIDGSLTVPTV